MTNPGPEFKAPPDSYPGLSPFRLAHVVCSPTPSNLHINTCGKKEEKAKTGREWGGSRDFVVRVLSSGPRSCICHWPGLAFFSISTTGCESLLDRRQEKCCEKQKPLQMRGGRTVTFVRAPHRLGDVPWLPDRSESHSQVRRPSPIILPAGPCTGMGLGNWGQETEGQGDFRRRPGTDTGLCSMGRAGDSVEQTMPALGCPGQPMGQSRKRPPPFLGDFYTHSLTHPLTHSFPEEREVSVQRLSRYHEPVWQ